MRIERLRPQVLQVRLHPLEMAALVTAARWVVGEREDDPPSAAVEQLRTVLGSYASEAAKLEPAPAVDPEELDHAQ